MGQIVSIAQPGIILTAVDRLVALNADGGVPPTAEHIILFGEDAGQNLANSNVIAIGAFALDAGMNDANLEGTVAIGVNAAGANTSGGAALGYPSANTIIGRNAAASAPQLAACVILGDNALPIFNATAANRPHEMVVIGNNALARFQNNNVCNTSVVIGARAMEMGASGNGHLQTAVIIGAQACLNALDSINRSVVIGYLAGANMASPTGTSQNVCIGSEAGIGLRAGASNTLIGESAAIFDSVLAANQTGSVCVGAGTIARGSYNTNLGAGVANSTATYTEGCVFIGYQAGSNIIVRADNRLLIETNNPNVGGRRALLYGDFVNGNLILGNSTNATDRDMPGTNIAKLINGTATGVPVGGGMFYGTGGELRWRSTNAATVDYLLTPHASRGVFTVATLPAAGLVAGQRAYVTDALAPAFAAAVAGGGAVFAPVYYDGAAWLCG
jgi:hypothetical protein